MRVTKRIHERYVDDDGIPASDKVTISRKVLFPFLALAFIFSAANTVTGDGWLGGVLHLAACETVLDRSKSPGKVPNSEFCNPFSGTSAGGRLSSTWAIAPHVWHLQQC
jgi:hypothetical protein